jgi:hypothetical protein
MPSSCGRVLTERPGKESAPALALAVPLQTVGTNTLSA